MPEIREQAMLMGARAAEAVREGWLPDSIQRSDEDLTALILDLRRTNQVPARMYVCIMYVCMHACMQDLTALILDRRRTNQEERRRLLAAREAARDSSHKAGYKAGYVCRHRHRHGRQTYKGCMPAVAARDSSHKAGRRPASYMSALYVCLLCLPYVSALYVP